MRYASAGRSAGYGRLSGGCKIFIDWRLGFRQSSFRPITRVPQRPTFDAFAVSAAFLACYCPHHLSDPGKPSDPGIILQIPPGWTGNMSRRFMAHRAHLPLVVLVSDVLSGDPIELSPAFRIVG